MSAKPKFDPADCRDCKWNHGNFSDEGFVKSGHCQMLEDAPPVKCALRCPALAMSKPQTARPSAGDWVQVKLSQYAKHRSIGRVLETTDSTVTVEVYRRRIERMEQHTLPSALIVGAAQEDDRLSCARELVELRSVRERRERLGCTQRQLAEVSGVDVGTLRSAELGDRRTHKHVRRWILEALRRVEARKVAS